MLKNGFITMKIYKKESKPNKIDFNNKIKYLINKLTNYYNKIKIYLLIYPETIKIHMK